MTINCRSCNNRIFKHEIKLIKYPVSLWPCKKEQSKKGLDLMVYFCKKCSLTQLQRFNNQTIYSFYKNKSKVLDNEYLIKNRVSKIKKIIKRDNNLKFLEIGGGRNNILKYFKNSKRWICDFDIEKIEKNINIIKSDFNNFTSKKKYFDYIFFFHTLEHIENPRNFLINVFDKLKDNGKIILEVPNIKYYTKKKPYYAFFFQHQSLFSLISLKNLMKVCSFKFEKLLSKKNDEVILIVFSKSNSKSDNFIKDINIVYRLKSKIKNRVKKIKKIIDKKNIKKIALYGCGGTSMTFFYYLRKAKILVDGFYDNDIRKFNLYIPNTKKKVKNGKKFNFNLYDLVLTTSNSLRAFLYKKSRKINILSLE